MHDRSCAEVALITFMTSCSQIDHSHPKSAASVRQRDEGDEIHPLNCYLSWQPPGNINAIITRDYSSVGVLFTTSSRADVRGFYMVVISVPGRHPSGYQTLLLDSDETPKILLSALRQQ